MENVCLQLMWTQNVQYIGVSTFQGFEEFIAMCVHIVQWVFFLTPLLHPVFSYGPIMPTYSKQAVVGKESAPQIYLNDFGIQMIVHISYWVDNCIM